MEQKSVFKSNIWQVFEIFTDEPLSMHYIKEISKKINLAPTSVKIYIKDLEKNNIIIRKKGERFEGYIANRENKNFLFYKKIINLIKIKESGVVEFIKDKLHPKTISLFGSYLKGEDIEKSDIDILIISKIRKDINLEKYEAILKRNIHLIIEEDLQKINKNLKLEIINGIVLEGYLEYG